ncbi:hypothetical protein A3A68_00715 [Candidatus Saccharibacteria bacterium RIFCSPLOWO2_01_FULL_48_13]|nr:MAG: hypothetical protein A2884_00060 [Candidatus Saccharibacteria bacterium RIFCSPHIGHO2_01_FULL_48_12]OGL35244.1 MAG: hypothetical protein A3F38_01040 [Candidatus Saccharibacteria bacterium RIFCSPHIGHO2_12_FULL_48_21]OGL37396.1 MAG: hypothetical protein A3A68_00715 [Candidatus Saccharibacteria bacterium RIFCSPLOWO2_01_FULL_48_13]
MKLVVLYHPKSEHGGIVEDYVRDFGRRRPNSKLKLVSLETREGAQMAELYDVVRYPAVLAIAKDGSLQKLWQSDTPASELPLMRDLDYYANS